MGMLFDVGMIALFGIFSFFAGTLWVRLRLRTSGSTEPDVFDDEHPECTRPVCQAWRDPRCGSGHCVSCCRMHCLGECADPRLDWSEDVN